MTTLRIDANRPLAQRVIVGADHTVILDLAPIAAGLVNDIAQAMKGRGHLFTVLANNRVGTPEHAAIRDEILRTLARSTALQPTLGPDQADDLATDLWDATQEPDWCDECADRYATIGELCGHCDEAASFRNALAGGRL